MSALSLRLAGLVLLTGLVTVSPTACQQIPYNMRVPYPSQPPGPVLDTFSASPGTITLDKAMTFTVAAHDRDNKKLSYGWAATGGTLSATTGTKVTWKPVKADGKPEAPGLYSVTVEVTNGKETETRTMAIKVSATSADLFQPQQTAGSPTTVASPQSGPVPSPSASGDTSAASQTGCAVGAVSPSFAQPGTVFTVSGRGFTDDATVELGETDVTVLSTTPTLLTALVPATVGIDGVALPVTVTSCGQAKKATGTLTMGDTSDFDGDVRTAGMGLLATVSALEPGSTGLPDDLDKQKALATFIASKIDLPPTQLRAGVPTPDGPRTADFAIRYTGQIQIATAGTTGFNLTSESGARLSIDGKVVVEDAGSSNRGTDGEVTLSAGKHSFRLEYRHGAGTQTSLQLYWSPPGAAEAIVPASVFSLPGTL